MNARTVQKVMDDWNNQQPYRDYVDALSAEELDHLRVTYKQFKAVLAWVKVDIERGIDRPRDE